MASKKAISLLLFAVVAAAALLLLLLADPGAPPPAVGAGDVPPAESVEAMAVAGQPPAGDAAPPLAAPVRSGIGGLGRGGASVRGRVLHGWTLEPLAGVEVLAVTTLPNFERLETRFRSMMGGLWKPDPAPPRVLGSTVSGTDGGFELAGLPAGRVFLDGRSGRYYVRTPASARLAADDARDGIELLCFPGGRVRGRVIGPEGQPVAGAKVSLRPGLNAFLGQVTTRSYRWLETATDADGYYDLPGVPAGHGYSATASASTMALVEAHGISVAESSTTSVDLHGGAGATVAGQVLAADGTPIAAAQVAMIYMDVSRVLFSTDGGEPILTDAEGRFRLARVAAGAVALMAGKDGHAPSPVATLQVVDGGFYPDVVLELGSGDTLAGRVVDDRDQPLADALVEVMPMERPQDPDVVKMALRLREVTGSSGADGRFAVPGVVAERVFVQVSKPGYVTRVRFGVRLGEELSVKLERGAGVRGRVLTRSAAGSERPVTRFRVEARSREIDAAGNEVEGSDPRQARRAVGGMLAGRGGRREAGMRLSAGRKISERRPDDQWQEVHAADGRFSLDGVPPGRIRVRVRADGLVDAADQVVDLPAGATSDELVFTMDPGITVAGEVRDAATGRPVPEAQVTAYRDERERRGGMFRFSGDAEDFDFLGLSSLRGRNSVLTDGHGRFTLPGLREGSYRFTARHPDRAKASAKDVELSAAGEPPEVVIELSAGGAIEGVVTGRGGRRVANALVVAATLQAGALKSASTDPEGLYRIDGLPPGRYLVFKSRLEESATNLLYDLLGNMRLKTVTVRDGETTRQDILDETENSVRVHGVVRDGDGVVPRAIVTALGQDGDGIFGIGVRAKPTDEQGAYELIGVKPGSYFFQVVRFNQRPEQASLEVDVPDGVTELRVDLDLPQSYVAGRVVDSRGEPVAGIEVAAGVESGGMSQAGGLLGLIMRNGVGRTRTDSDGSFKLTRVAAGVYRLTVSGDRGRRANRRYGEAAVGPLTVDGRAPIDNVLITVPLAGRIRGVVRDGNGAPVAGAEIGYVRQDQQGRRPDGDELTDLFGLQRRSVRSDERGEFLLDGLSPGTYTVTADRDDKTSDPVRDVAVGEDGEVGVEVTLIRGATLRVRVRNIDGRLLPMGSLQLVGGDGQPLTRKLSAWSLFRRVMGSQTTKDDTGWREFGGVPPDTYTLIVQEEGKPEFRVTRTVGDGETVAWDLDMTEELAKRR